MAAVKEITGRIPPVVYEALREVADTYCTTMNAVLTAALIEHLEKNYGLTVRPQRAHSEGKMPSSQDKLREPTVPPPCPQSEPTVPPQRAQKGDLGVNGSLSGETEKEKEPTTGGAGGEDTDPEFEAFYSAYPKKRKRPDAFKAWTQMAKKRPPLATLLESVALWAKSTEWTKDNGEFIPYPASWLRAKGWDDVPTPLPPAKIDGSQYPVGSPEWREWRISQLRPTA